MKKIMVFNLVTVDGYFAGPKGEIDWHNTDDEFNEFAIEHTRAFGALIFGRVTHDLMASYWPTEDALKNDPLIAKMMNSIPKIVYSKGKKMVDGGKNWKNVKLYKEIVPAEVKKLKGENGKDIAIFGSGTIVQQFTNLGLIDEYRFIVNPIILGKGKPMFKDVKKMNLKLLKTRTFKNGNVLLCYSTQR